jgi:hypothetical protein
MWNDAIEIKREELYEQVWSEPVSQVAKRYQLSDVGLAKICKRFQIPLPWLGYWQKKRHGKSVQRPALPPLTNPTQSVIRIERRTKPMVDPVQDSDLEAKITFERLPENHIKVPPELHEPHPYVVAAEKSLRHAKSNDSGILMPRSAKCLDVSVSSACLDRALRTMDTLIKALEARQFKASV